LPRALAIAALLLTVAGPVPGAAARDLAHDDAGDVPIAGAFVYPVGDELDYTKPHAGEVSGFHVSDPYEAVREGPHGRRVHKGVDLADGSAGAPVRAAACGVVEVADVNGLIQTRTPYTVKAIRRVQGKRVVRWRTRYRVSSHWRTGWGNYVVIRHVLANGKTVHTLYGHLKPRSILVKAGDLVAAGEVIARVGQSGHATSPHLHFEVRDAQPAVSADDDFDPEEAENATVEDRTFALLAPVDPLAFMERHVHGYDDLEPGTWQARYALAALRDGIVAEDQDSFQPDDSITRADFYAALGSAFRIPGTAGAASFSSLRQALLDAGVLNAGSSGERAGDHLTRAEAVEVLLRCAERSAARGYSLSSFGRERICDDFNRVFAGSAAAAKAERDARAAALAETAARRKAADAEYARALRARKAAVASGSHARKRVKRAVVKPAVAAPRLDPGFAALAQSEQPLTRAEACLLLASTFRLGNERMSALEQAAARVASAG
jgi:murein DD-endopeptidase MepM/ murein hydrolase activator NlpD